mgnify:CR=1 FL=1
MASYCTRSDVEGLYGSRNVAVWADLNNDQDATIQAAAIARAIETASELIDSKLRNTVYSIPMRDHNGSTPVLIREIAATLAGVALFTARGGSMTRDEETGAAVHRYSARELWAETVLEELRLGRRVIEAC